MYWMAVDIDVHSNGKVLSLAEQLDMNPDEAVGLMVRLWAHAMRNSDRTGRLRHATPAVFSEVLRRPRDRTEDILALLVELGLLEEREGGYAVHGWEERQAAWYAYQEKRDYDKQRNMERKAARREAHEKSGEARPVNFTGNHTAPNPTVPDPTPTDRTQADETGSVGERGCAPCAPGAPAPVSQCDKKRAEDVIALYNELCPSLPKASATPRRREAALRCLRRSGIDVIHDAFEKAGAAQFLTGQNNRGWKATFDWLIKEDNLVKVLEGNFEHSGGRCPDPDAAFSMSREYTKEQFDSMHTNVFDLADL